MSSEDKKVDVSNTPRGAIGIKGLPVNRNARLPSLRSPRDLTLGAQPKRTFMPNIPARREKQPKTGPNQTSNQSASALVGRRTEPSPSDRGRGRGRAKPQIIQTTGSVFGEGVAAPAVSAKTALQENQSRPSSSPGKIQVKREIKDLVYDVHKDMSNLLRDDFIDDDSDSDSGEGYRPIVFPFEELKQDQKKEEEKTESTDFQNKDVAKEMGYDIGKIAKFIKKEKADKEYLSKATTDLSRVPKNDATDFITSESSEMFLLRFPVCLVPQNPEEQMRRLLSCESEPTVEEKNGATLLSSMLEGRVGKLQVLKSGRVRLVIGPLHYDLDSLDSLRTRHEIASVNTSAGSESMSVLGTVQQKLVFAPDISKILDTVLK